MALGYLYLEQFSPGLEAIRECLARTAEPQEGRSALSRTIREWTFVQLALELGLIEEARQHAAACERYGRWGDNPRASGLAAIANGLCQIYAGDVTAGLEILECVLAKTSE